MNGCGGYMAAKFTVEGFDDYFGKLKTLSAGSRVNSIAKMGLYDGADVLADEIKARCPVDDGDLKASLFISRFTTTDGGCETEIGFAGYDRDGVPNQMKANILESGTSKKKKHPFVRPAFNAVKNQAQAAIVATCERELKKALEE